MYELLSSKKMPNLNRCYVFEIVFKTVYIHGKHICKHIPHLKRIQLQLFMSQPAMVNSFPSTKPQPTQKSFKHTHVLPPQ